MAAPSANSDETDQHSDAVSITISDAMPIKNRRAFGMVLGCRNRFLKKR
jgi:hypothetical protein